MTTPQEPKGPLEKPGTSGAGTKTDTAGAAGAGSTAGGAKGGGVKPQDDDRPPQN
jgi:hypothetical protein